MGILKPQILFRGLAGDTDATAKLGATLTEDMRLAGWRAYNKNASAKAVGLRFVRASETSNAMRNIFRLSAAANKTTWRHGPHPLCAPAILSGAKVYVVDADVSETNQTLLAWRSEEIIREFIPVEALNLIPEAIVDVRTGRGTTDDTGQVVYTADRACRIIRIIATNQESTANEVAVAVLGSSESWAIGRALGYADVSGNGVATLYEVKTPYAGYPMNAGDRIAVKGEDADQVAISVLAIPEAQFYAKKFY